jgi:hypothetical protein
MSTDVAYFLSFESLGLFTDNSHPMAEKAQKSEPDWISSVFWLTPLGDVE